MDKLFGLRATNFLFDLYKLAVAYELDSIPKSMNIIISLFSSLNVLNYYERRLELQLESKDGSVPFDWQLLFNMAVAVFTNIGDVYILARARTPRAFAFIGPIVVVNVIIFIVYIIL